MKRGKEIITCWANPLCRKQQGTGRIAGNAQRWDYGGGILDRVTT